MPSKGHIFLSYRSTETDFSLQLAKDLKNAGINVWMALLNIKPGDNWRQLIEQALKPEECKGLIAVLSPNYIASDYCRQELATAADLRIPIFPLLLSTIPVSDRPLEVRLLQFIDFKTWHVGTTYRNQLDKLINRLCQDTYAHISIPNPQTQYLTSLKAELEKARWGTLKYVRLAAQSEILNADAEKKFRSDLRQEDIHPEYLELVELYAKTEPILTPRDKRTAGKQLNDILDAVKELQRFALIGEPGAGKTTTLRRLALDAVWECERNTDSPIPLFLELPKWKDDQTIEEFIAQNWTIPDIELMSGLAQGKVFLYLDGLNEMGASGLAKFEQLRDWIHGIDSPQCVVITCRARDYKSMFDLKIPIILIKEMDEQRIRQFAINYLGKENANPFLAEILREDNNAYQYARYSLTVNSIGAIIEYDEEQVILGKEVRSSISSLYYLARNPYLLRGFIYIYSNTPSHKIPKNIGTLFQGLVETLLLPREEQRQTLGMLTVKEIIESFGNLAFAMIDEQKPTIVPLSYALKYINKNDLLSVGENANLVMIEDDTVRFYHPLLQEYFAAIKLKQLGLHSRLKPPTISSLFVAYREPSKWDQVIIALCGISSDSDSTVRQIIPEDPWLAAECIASGINISEIIHQELVDGFIAKLRDKDHDIAAAGISALSEIGGTELIPVFLEAQHSQHSMVRRQATNALGRLGDKSVVPHLIQALYDGDQMVVSEASHALGKRKDFTAVNALIETLHKYTYIAVFPDPFSLDELNPYLIAEALKDIGTQEALTAIQNWEREVLRLKRRNNQKLTIFIIIIILWKIIIFPYNLISLIITRIYLLFKPSASGSN